MSAFFLDIPVTTIGGETRNIGSFLGKVTLIVNVASKCGFTPQYAGLETLYEKFKDRGLAILGFPCDQFGHQEPGDEREIQSFCTLNYQVNFPLFAKIEVNGRNTHRLYRELKAASPGILGTRGVKWNFTKFLLDAQGRVIKRFAPSTKPEKLSAEIAALLDQQNA
ncbi:MAG TPA: glutathione peroxidase [Steroidobacteraceae bacterium]|nr:glutathione peroxidase [Steroidobacteraceae bacterium]